MGVATFLFEDVLKLCTQSHSQRVPYFDGYVVTTLYQMREIVFIKYIVQIESLG